MTKLSIIMPVYNASKYIDEAIESIQNQTFTDWELIIVNEPTTTDNTNDIVTSYMEQDDRIRLIINAEQLGIARSLNIALDNATGELIARMDADDIALPERFAEQVKYMENNPEVGISGCDYDVVGEKWKSNLVTNEEDIRSDLLFFVPLRHPTIIMRKSLLMDNGVRYNDDILAAEDYDLFVNGIEKFRITNIPSKLLVYRRHEEATVYRMLKEGVEVNKKLGEKMFESMGLYFSDEQISALYRHCLLGNDNCAEYNSSDLRELEELLITIWKKNIEIKKYSNDSLYMTLTKRWEKEKSIAQKSRCIKKDELDAILCNEVFSKNFDKSVESKCESLLVIIQFNDSCNNTIKAIRSIANQSYTDWKLELIGVTDDIILKQKIDMICYVNSGIGVRYANSHDEMQVCTNDIIYKTTAKYIMVLSGHDYCFKNNFEVMISSLINNPSIEVAICDGRNSTHMCESNDIDKLKLLFGKNIDSSSCMFKKEVYISYIKSNNSNINCYFVNHCRYLSIKKELYEKDFSYDANLEKGALEELYKESLKINLSQKQLDMILKKDSYLKMQTADERKKFRNEFDSFLKLVLKKNKKYNSINIDVLVKEIELEWADRIGRDRKPDYSKFKMNSDISNNEKLKFHNKIIMKFDRFFYNHSKYMHYDHMLDKYINSTVRNVDENQNEIILHTEELIKRWTWERYQRINKDVETLVKRWTWERYQRIEKDLAQTQQKVERKIDAKVWDAERRIIALDDLAVQMSFENNKVHYNSMEKIRVAVIFQVASFWPSIAPLYEEMKKDDMFEIKIICYDEDYDKTIKTETAREFLIENNIDFVDWIDFSLDRYSPHIVFLQTPYDGNRRKEYKSNYLKMAGYRVVYIPYGMEIGDTEHSRKQQLDNIVRRYAWKVFTFSDVMRRDYRLYSEAFDNVCVTGLPKFDSLYHKEEFPLDEGILKQANGRRIILWKVHFPKVAYVNGKLELFTPELNEYIGFTDYVASDNENFYIFMPHPRFLEFNEDEKIQRQLQQLMQKIMRLNNVYIDNRDDYRYSLLNADAIIVDRSSVMVEAAAVGVPVLFMYNSTFREPMTKAIEPLVDSYYQGTKTEDMIQFVKMINEGNDPKKELREMQFQICIPHFDGNCAVRIKEEIVHSLQLENEQRR